MSDTAPRKGPRGKARQAEADQAAAETAEQAAAETAEQVEAEQAAAEQAGGQAKPDLDEVKRKFRAALDRKREVNAGEGAGDSGRDAGKIHGAHGPAAGRRSFRRKSG
ncbi:MAG TPA: DUF5302 domain-containing protein [Trebonia sp.]